MSAEAEVAMTWRERWRARKVARQEARALARMPKPPCGDQHWRIGRCDLPEGHDGNHGRVISRRVKTGGFIESTSVTREMWT